MIQPFQVGPHQLLFDLDPDQFVSDRNLLWYAQNKQMPEPEVIHAMLRALKPGDCAIDAGANVGFFSVLMSKIVGDRGKILAVEPDSRNIEKLKKNLDINSCGNVEIHAHALGQERVQGGLRHDADNGQSWVCDACADEAVTIDTLDFAMERLPKWPALLKLDIEGSEVAALLGTRFFAFPCIISEINDGALKRAGHSAKDLFTLLRERGYNRYQLHANGAMPSRIDASQTVKLSRENTNMLFAFRDYVPKLWQEVDL